MVKRLTTRARPFTVAEPVPRWNYILDNAVRLLGSFGFQQIAPPPVEEAKIFQNSALLRHRFGRNLHALGGDGDKSYVLSPTHLTGAAKLYLEAAAVRGPHVAKWFYVAPLVREFGKDLAMEHEIGVLILGDESSLAMAQLVSSVAQTLRSLGIADVNTELVSRGCVTCQREYHETLQNFLHGQEDQLCEDCQRHAADRVINVFSCATPGCQELLAGAPQMMDFLDESCRADLAETLEIMDELSLPYTLNPALTGTLAPEKFLFRMNASDNSVLGHGGNLTSMLVRSARVEPMPVLGFISTLEQLTAFVPDEARRPIETLDVFVIPVGPAAARKALTLHRDLMNAGVRVSEAMLESQGIKGQLKTAADRKCEMALIIGQKEAMDETVILRDIRSGMQEIFTVERIVEEVQKRLGK